MLYLAGMQYFAIFVASILMVVQGFKAYLASDNENMIGLGPIATGLILIVRCYSTEDSEAKLSFYKYFIFWGVAKLLVFGFANLLLIFVIIPNQQLR